MDYIKVHGLYFKITAVMESVDTANEYMEENEEQGVIAEQGSLILLADVNDEGLTELPEGELLWESP